MHRICSTLAENGYSITLVGRQKKTSIALNAQPFQQVRLNCIFEKGKTFYIEYNLRLFFYLLFQKCDAICAIDLDTILASYYSSKIKGKKFIYDSHEYFTEQFEVATRPRIKKAWLSLEKHILPKVKFAYTVNRSIADIYHKKYKTPFEVIRNVPVLSLNENTELQKHFIYIGAVNEGRGLELLIDCMQDIPTQLYICGDGDIIERLKKQVEGLHLKDKVIFKGFVQPNELKRLTQQSYAGVNILDKTSVSYYYSLANKFFDYIHAEIPQLTVNFPEYRFINQQHEVAYLVDMNRNQIIDAANKLLENTNGIYDTLKANTKTAKEKYNWQNESKRLLSFYKKVFKD